MEVDKMPKMNKKEPFFHITQPGIQRPVPNMQETFSSKAAEREKKKTASANNVKDLNDHETLGTKEHEELAENERKEVVVKESGKATELIENYEAENRENESESSLAPHIRKRPEPSFKRLKSFKEMNTEERINYLLNFPIQLPPVPCVFETEAGSFRGVLIGKTDELIEIKLLDGKTRELQIQSVKEIRMVGIRK